MKILAIDDNQDILTMLQEVVQEALPGAVLVTATDGSRGMELARAEDPDVILLDIVMPGVSGFEVCRRMKADEQLREIPVVFLTSIGTVQESRVRALELGAEAFLSQPVDEPELVAAVQAMAKLKAANRRKQREKAELAALVAERTQELERELTQHRQTEAALRESEERYTALFDRSLDCVFLTDFDGRFLDANQASLDLLGYQRADLARLTLASLLTEDQLPLAFRLIEEIKTTGQQNRPAEFRLRGKDGRQIHVETQSSLMYREGKPVAIQGIARDLTARKRAEESNFRLATAVEQAAETIVITDANATILYANPAFENISGYTRAEAIGQNPRILKSGKQDAGFYREMWETLKRGEVWTGHFINKRKDGSLYEEEATISPIRDALGAIVSYVAVKRDATREVELESRLRESQKMEAIGTLAGGIAHDFNNILAAIFGYTNLLEWDLRADPEAMEKLGQIMQAGNRAKELVQQILTFGRRQALERQIIRLNNTVKEATKLLRASLPANIQIECNLASNAPTVLADATQMYQVLLNLGTNALHAMGGQPAGQLTITLEAIQPDKNLLQAHSELRAIPYARLTVADTGHGMDAKTLERIYEPFFTTKPVGKGTGLGLAVVHGIVRSHDGVITVESQPGQGTTFRLYLPAQMEDEFLAGMPPGTMPLGQGQRILVVEDEAALATLYQRLLKALQYDSTSTNQPSEAIAWVREDPAQFDLVITDLTMPEMNGLEAARQIRALRADLPIIMATGYKATVTQKQLKEAGICELYEKPISMTTIAEALHRVLGKG